VNGPSGWQWLDEKVPSDPVWRWYEDGTPSDPGAKFKTSNLMIDPSPSAHLRLAGV